MDRHLAHHGNMIKIYRSKKIKIVKNNFCPNISELMENDRNQSNDTCYIYIYTYNSTRRIQKRYICIYIYISWKPAHIQGKTSSIIIKKASWKCCPIIFSHLLKTSRDVWFGDDFSTTQPGSFQLFPQGQLVGFTSQA